jgi:hypothetical protein
MYYKITINLKALKHKYNLMLLSYDKCHASLYDKYHLDLMIAFTTGHTFTTLYLSQMKATNPLTERERAVPTAAVQGARLAEIAASLFLSKGTLCSDPEAQTHITASKRPALPNRKAGSNSLP